MLVLELTAQGLVRQRAVLTNDADEVFGLDALLLTLPVPAVATELLDFTGRWARERSPQRTAFTHGTRLRENRRGRTGYDAAFVLVAGTAGLREPHRRGLGPAHRVVRQPPLARRAQPLPPRAARRR